MSGVFETAAGQDDREIVAGVRGGISEVAGVEDDGLIEERLAAFVGGFVFLVVTIASFGLAPYLGSNFFPDIDSGEIKLHVRAQTGLRLENTTQLCTRESKFEISEQGDCGARGLASTGFVPVDMTSGGKTLRFALP